MADEPNLDTPDAGDLNTAARKVAAQRGWAMSDGAYPIRPENMHGRADLQKAIRAVGRGGASHDAIRRHIIKRARAIGHSDMIPDNWTSTGASETRLEQGPALEFREASLAGVNFEQRLIEVVAAPYETPTMVRYRGNMWEESFERGAFDGIETRQGQVRVNRDHDKSRTVGKVVQFWPSRREGLVTEVRIAKTPLGDETLALADEDMLSASVGFVVKRPSDEMLDRRQMTRRVKRAFLDHQSFVESPAYPDARVLSVNAQHDPYVLASELPDFQTPDLDELIAFHREHQSKRAGSAAS